MATPMPAEPATPLAEVPGQEPHVPWEPDVLRMQTALEDVMLQQRLRLVKPCAGMELAKSLSSATTATPMPAGCVMPIVALWCRVRCVHPAQVVSLTRCVQEDVMVQRRPRRV